MSIAFFALYNLNFQHISGQAAFYEDYEIIGAGYAEALCACGLNGYCLFYYNLSLLVLLGARKVIKAF